MSAHDDNTTMNADDPRVTAWAIGAEDTLSAEERRAIAQAVAKDPALADEIAALKALDAALAAELGGADVAPLDAAARAEILTPPAAVIPITAARRRWPALAIGGGALAAAAALLVVALQPSDTAPADAPPGPAIAAGEPVAPRPAPPKSAPGTASVASTEAPPTAPSGDGARAGESAAPAQPTTPTEIVTTEAAPKAKGDAARVAGGLAEDAPDTDADVDRPPSRRSHRNDGGDGLRYAQGPSTASGSSDGTRRQLNAQQDVRSGSEALAALDNTASLEPTAPQGSSGSRYAATATATPLAGGEANNALGDAEDVGGGRVARGDTAGHIGYHGVGRGKAGLVVVRDRVIVVPPYPRDVLYPDGYVVTEPARPVVPWPFRPTAAQPLSTFSIDVDTASLSHARRYLTAGRGVPSDLVRVEEIVNAFHYGDPAPTGDAPIAVHVEVADAPWQPANRLVRVAITSRPVENGDRAPANLVFLVDTSGSMRAKEKLPLLVDALRKLVDNLGEDDRVAIVSYASKAKVVLEPTSAADKDAILGALSKLRAAGYTNGGAGLDVAYDLARRSFLRDGANRVILATDGDFNSGETDNWSLQRTIRDKARSGVMLSVLGFGRTGYDDHRLELLAQHGDGRYAFIDSLEEANRVLGRELDATLVTAAKDVRVQVELNPAQALGYRLIGYENRGMAASEFNQEGKDAGDLGAGESVVAFYEVIPVPGTEHSAVDAPRYAADGSVREQGPAGGDDDEGVAQELMVVKVRWVPPKGGHSERLDVPVVDHGQHLDTASPDFLFSAGAAAFGMKLQGWSDPSRLVSWGLVEDLVRRSLAWWGADDARRQLLDLAQRARRIYGGP